MTSEQQNILDRVRMSPDPGAKTALNEEQSSILKSLRGEQPATTTYATSREVKGTGERQSAMGGAFQVRDELKGMGQDPFTSESRAKAAALPEYMNLKAAGAAVVSSDVKDKSAILKNFGVDVREEGGIHFVYKDGEAIGSINKPGMGTGDVIGFLSDVAQSFPAGRIASAGKTVFSKAIRAFALEAATQTVREGYGMALGADFDPIEIGVNAILGAGGEALVPFAKNLYDKLSPTQRSQALQAKNIQDLIEAGMNERELREVLSNVQEFKDSVGRLPSLAEVAPKRLETMMTKSARADAGRTRYVERQRIEKTATQQSKLNESLDRISSADQGVAGENAAKEARKIINTETDVGKEIVTEFYTKAFAGAKPTDVVGLRNLAKNILDTDTLRNSVPERKIANIREQLLPKQYLEGVKKVNAAIDKEISKLKDSDIFDELMSGPQDSSILGELNRIKQRVKDGILPGDLSDEAKALGIELPEMPLMEMNPEDLQKAIWAMRDALKSADGSVNASVKKAMKPLEDATEKVINKATGGKYKLADDQFKLFKDDIDKLTKSPIGSAAKETSETLGRFYGRVFSTDPAMRLSSRRFLKGLAKSNPQAARDLYGSYFRTKALSLGEDATPSDILETVFGDENSRKVIYELGGIVDPRITKQLMSVEAVLKAQKKTEGFNSKLADEYEYEKGIDKLSNHMLQPGVLFKLWRKRSQEADLSKYYIAIMTDPRWYDSWMKVLNKSQIAARANKQQLGYQKEASESAYDATAHLLDSIKASWKSAETVESLAPGVSVGLGSKDLGDEIEE
jgi:hypothetical protein